MLQIFWIVQAGRSEVAPASDVCGTGTDSVREEMLPYEQGVGPTFIPYLFCFYIDFVYFCRNVDVIESLTKRLICLKSSKPLLISE